MSKPKQDAVNIAVGRASTVTFEQVGRHVRMYPVSVSELRELSRLNTTQAGFMSAGTLLIGVALPDLFNVVASGEQMSRVEVIRTVLFGLLALLGFALAWWHRREVKEIWTTIGIETEKPPNK